MKIAFKTIKENKMIPMVHMILKWEKELERPNRPFIQHQIYAHLLKAKKENQSERKTTQHTKTQKRCDLVNLVECQICNELVRNYAVRENEPKIGGASGARTPYFRASPRQLRNSY